MALVNSSTREINVKLVYCGAGLSGKTTNLQHIYTQVPAHAKGRLISLATETERTLFFDFLPIRLGMLRGFQVRIHLYSVPGQVFYGASRKVILKGADGVAFVVDSHPLRLDANVESFLDMGRCLAEHGLGPTAVPTVVQYNKRDLPDAVPVDRLRRALGNPTLPEFEAVAATGAGVFDTLKALTRGAIDRLRR